MANTLVETQLKDVRSFLELSSSRIEEFLNSVTLASLQPEGGEKDGYMKEILGHLRRILVFSEESLDACNVILQGTPFQKAAAERILYRIYHQCINEFFSPKNDAWFEDSRSAYTGRNSIKFHKEVPEEVTILIQGLEGGFQKMREELEYYETDYRTKMIQSK